MKIYRIAQENKEIIPKLEKGNCFKNVIQWVTRNEGINDSVIVHGKVTNHTKNVIDHAWIEMGNSVIDPTVGVKMDKIEYYAITKAEADSKYSSEQALINAIRSKNGGPWTKQEVGNRYLFRVD